MGTSSLRRLATIVVGVVVGVLAIASPAHASDEGTVWVDGHILRFLGGTHATNLVIKSPDGSMEITDGGNPIIAGAGCIYGAPDASVVHCIGGGALVWVSTGDTNDRVAIVLTGTYFETTAKINVGGGDDTVYGGPYDDIIFGGPGNDFIDGRDGNDTITPGAGADTVRDTGRAGDADTVQYTDSPTGVTADLDDATGDDGAPGEGDTLIGIENLVGSPYNDILTGNSGINKLTGCGGSDRLDGLAGNDELTGDGSGCGTIGADVMIGGPGIDGVHYEHRTARLIVSLLGTTADDGQSGEHDQIGDDVENVSGSLGNDILIGNAAANILDGRGGNDTVLGLDGDDVLFGSDGNDGMFGGNGNDRLHGENGDDTLDGGNGIDTVYGGNGTDTCRYWESASQCELPAPH